MVRGPPFGNPCAMGTQIVIVFHLIPCVFKKIVGKYYKTIWTDLVLSSINYTLSSKEVLISRKNSNKIETVPTYFQIPC